MPATKAATTIAKLNLNKATLQLADQLRCGTNQTLAAACHKYLDAYHAYVNLDNLSPKQPGENHD